jgi:hypothetical protein
MQTASHIVAERGGVKRRSGIILAKKLHEQKD